MQLLQGQRFIREILKKTARLRVEVLVITTLCLLLQLLESCLVLYFLQLYPSPISDLYTSNSWYFLQFFTNFLGALAKIACFWHLWFRCSQAAQMLHSKQTYSKRKMLLLSIQNAFLRTAFLQIVPFLLFFALRLAEIGTSRTNSAPWLFGAVQLVVAAVLCFFLWIYISIGLWCAPFLWLSNPTLPLWRVPFRAMRVMAGARKELFILLAWYGLQMLPIVTIPWILPQLALALTIFFHIRIRLFQEAEKDKNTPLPSWKERIVTH